MGTRKPAGKSKIGTRANMRRRTGAGICPRSGDPLTSLIMTSIIVWFSKNPITKIYVQSIQWEVNFRPNHILRSGINLRLFDQNVVKYETTSLKRQECFFFFIKKRRRKIPL